MKRNAKSFIVKLISLIVLSPIITSIFNYIIIGISSLYIFVNIYAIISYFRNKKGIKKEELKIDKFLKPVISLIRKLFYAINLKSPITVFLIMGLIIGYRESGIPKSLFVFSLIILIINLSWELYRNNEDKEIPSLKQIRKEYCY